MRWRWIEGGPEEKANRCEINRTNVLAGPLSIGSEPVKEIATVQLSTGKLSLLSPTDCVKDRLAAYYHWNDLQCLEQAVMVALDNRIDLKEVERWSRVENKYQEFLKIKNRLSAD